MNNKKIIIKKLPSPWGKNFPNYSTVAPNGYYIYDIYIDSNQWDGFPEYLDGDFLSLKDIDHGWAPKDPATSWDVARRISEFQKNISLDYLCEVYKFWIAFGNCISYSI